MGNISGDDGVAQSTSGLGMSYVDLGLSVQDPSSRHCLWTPKERVNQYSFVETQPHELPDRDALRHPDLYRVFP